MSHYQPQHNLLEDFIIQNKLLADNSNIVFLLSLELRTTLYHHYQKRRASGETDVLVDALIILPNHNESLFGS